VQRGQFLPFDNPLGHGTCLRDGMGVSKGLADLFCILSGGKPRQVRTKSRVRDSNTTW
jgi:hypothetical protein